jgi:hypothetical protein
VDARHRRGLLWKKRAKPDTNEWKNGGKPLPPFTWLWKVLRDLQNVGARP